MGKQKFNHQADVIDEAVGIDSNELQERLVEVVKGGATRSENIESISKNFTKVEIAFMFEIAVTNTARLEKMLTNPLAGLFSGDEE